MSRGSRPVTRRAPQRLHQRLRVPLRRRIVAVPLDPARSTLGGPGMPLPRSRGRVCPRAALEPGEVSAHTRGVAAGYLTLKISVIMAAWNAERTIATAVDSFLAQQHPDRELIVIDGASTDRTRAIVEGFASPLIRLVSEPDKGIYDAINKGIVRAQGDVIGLLHANDRFADPRVLSEVAREMADPDLSVVYADAELHRLGDPSQTVRHYRSDIFSPRRLSLGIMPAHTTMFFRRGVFDEFGLYRTDMRIAADFEFVARVFQRPDLRYRYVPRTWTRMELGGASTTGLRSKIRINSEILRGCKLNGIRSNWGLMLARYAIKIPQFFVRYGNS